MTDLCDYVQLTGRPDCEEQVPGERKSMHLSQRISGVYLRQEAKGASHHEKADRTVGGRIRRKYKIKELEASCIRA